MSGSHAHRGALTQRAAIASIGVATVLLGLKFWAERATGSVAMLGSLADTALDLLSALATFYAVWLAAQPADADHRFGHGKAEAIAALMQTLVILGSAVAIGWRAVLQFGNTGEPHGAAIGIVVSLVGVVMSLSLVAYQRRVVRATGSIAIVTDQLHYESDLMLNIAVIAALGLDVLAGLHGADAVFGIGIAVYLGVGAVRSARSALDMLMDREWPDAKRRRLFAVVDAHPELDGVHALRTRSSGVTDFIQFHVWLAPEMTVKCAHDIVERVEADVAAAFPGAEIMIHVDPVGHFDRPPQHEDCR